MHANLRSFIQQLRAEHELIEIAAAVDPVLELAEIHRRVIAQGGPALLFKSVGDSQFPVITNLFGTAKRIDLGLGVRPKELVKRMVHAAEALVPPKLSTLWQQKGLLLDALRMGTRNTRHAPVLEVVDQPARLNRLPVLTTWQEDGGPFLTLPLVYTEHPVTGKHNLGMYRVQRYDDESAGLHWQIHKGGGFHYHEAERLGQALPVNVLLGGPPALILAAIAPLPEDIPELVLASVLAGQPIQTTRNPLPDRLRLVAQAEFALVGHVPPYERKPEGPFGDHYGYYSLQHDYPVFHVEAVCHRADAIYPATVVGKPRQEDFYIGDYLQELLAPLFPLVMASVLDLWSYGETGFHSLTAAVVRERYAREALVSAFRILGEGQLSLTKFLLVTDKRQDLRDFKSLFQYVLARTRFETDLFIFGNTSFDTLDYTSGTVNRGSKAVLVGTGDPIRTLPQRFTGALPVGVTIAEVFCPGCLVLQGPSYRDEPALASRVAGHRDFASWPIIVLHDDASVARSAADFLWATWTRFEPAADISARAVTVVHNHLAYEAPVVIDARMKPGYPDELAVRDDIAQRVDARWREYFPTRQSWES